MKSWLNDPQRMVKLHFWLAIAWIVPGVIVGWVIVYQLPDPHAAFAILVVSLYANSVSHWAAFQAVRAEVAANEGSDKP